jgi:hypothetical protein
MTKIEETLSGKKRDIVKKCINLTMESYPPETSESLKREKDRFLNPAGFTISSEIENVFDEVIGAMDLEKLVTSLESVIKLRAVQNFPPSEAISFVYLLKRSIREELAGNLDAKSTRGVTQARDGGRRTRDAIQTWDEKARPVENWAELDERLDRVALLAFDVYMRCREKIHEIRLRETKAFHGRR